MLTNCLLLALHQRRLRARVPPELFQLLYWAFVDPDHSLRQLCEEGALSDLRHWHGVFGIVVYNPYSALKIACMYGQVEVAQWLYSHLHLAPAASVPAFVNDAFHVACRHLPMAQWWHDTFAMATADVQHNVDHVMQQACYHGGLSTVQWLVRTFDLKASRRSLWLYLSNTCATRHVDLADWLVHVWGSPDMIHPKNTVGALQAACHHGQLSMVKWWCRTFTLTVDMMNYSLLRITCRGGRADIMRWLLQQVDPLCLPAQLRFQCVAEACRSGNLPMAQWLDKTFQLCDVADRLILYHAYEAIDGACFLQHFDAAQWLVDTYIDVDAMQSHHVRGLQTVCESNNLAAVQWYHRMFTCITDHARIRCGFPLRRACAEGRLAMAQWLTDTFDLTQHHAHYEYPLYDACSNGHFHVVQWLVHAFALTRAEICVDHCTAFQHACKSGHLHLAQWLQQKFALTIDDVTMDDVREPYRALFRNVCSLGHARVARWLHHSFAPAPGHDREYVHSILMLACTRGRLAGAQLLHDTFQLTAAQVRRDNNAALRSACTLNALALVEWLITTFQLTAADAAADNNAAERQARRCGNVALLVRLQQLS